MIIDLWQRWRTEYLSILQKRNKWKFASENLLPGDLVLLKDSNVFQCSWPMGKITAVYAGADKLVRAVDVRVNGKTLRRPIHKLVRFLGKDEASSPRGEDVQAS